MRQARPSPTGDVLRRDSGFRRCAAWPPPLETMRPERPAAEIDPGTASHELRPGPIHTATAPPRRCSPRRTGGGAGAGEPDGRPPRSPGVEADRRHPRRPACHVDVIDRWGNWSPRPASGRAGSPPRRSPGAGLSPHQPAADVLAPGGAPGALAPGKAAAPDAESRPRPARTAMPNLAWGTHGRRTSRTSGRSTSSAPPPFRAEPSGRRSNAPEFHTNGHFPSSFHPRAAELGRGWCWRGRFSQGGAGRTGRARAMR